MRDQCDRTTKCRTLHIAQVHTVQHNAPRLGVIKTLQKLNDRRLTRTGRANKCYRFTRLHGERNTVKRRRIGPRGITESDVLKANCAVLCIGQSNRRHGVQHGIFGVQQLNQSLGRARRALQLGPDLGQGRHGARNHHRVDHELHQFTRGHRTGAYVIRPDPQHANNARKDEENHNHGHQRAGQHPLFRSDKTLFRHIRKLRACVPFGRKCLNGLNRQKCLGRSA